MSKTLEIRQKSRFSFKFSLKKIHIKTDEKNDQDLFNKLIFYR